MPRRKSFRSQLDRAARDLGNVEAVEHGGVEGGAKRYARRAVFVEVERGRVTTERIVWVD